jgi:5-methylcytosine-specific restriction endonuclease McrA
MMSATATSLCQCGECKRCRNREAARRWRERHPGAANAAAKRYRERTRDPEKHRAYMREWYRRNPEKGREHRMRYYAKNRERFWDWSAEWRARRADAFIEDVSREAVFAADHGLCGICGRPCDPEAFDLDHIQPLARGGAHCYANCQPAHPSCNRAKGAR